MEPDDYFGMVEVRLESSLGEPGYAGARRRLEVMTLSYATRMGRVCPECSAQCTSRAGLGAHRWYAHAVPGTHRTSVARREDREA